MSMSYLVSAAPGATYKAGTVRLFVVLDIHDDVFIFLGFLLNLPHVLYLTIFYDPTCTSSPSLPLSFSSAR